MAHGEDSQSGPSEPMRLPATLSPSLLFHVGQYNILAANLANNMKPWFWYGYRGINPAQPPVYMGDCLDPVRVEVLGYGRSKKLIQAWNVTKEYFKVFDEEYGYKVQDVRHYSESKESPSIVLRHLLHKAIFDFFHRRDTDNRWGNRKLAHHLFDRACYDFGLLESIVLRPLGYALEEEQWADLEAQKAGMSSLCGPELTQAIVRFNAALRRGLVLLRRRHHQHHHEFELNEERIEAEFHEVALELGTFLCLSDDDLHRIIEHQEQMEWGVRGAFIIQEIQRMAPHLIGLEEVDRIDYLTTHLAPSLRLAVFKHRKVTSVDDGCAIFYDPATFALIHLPPQQQADEGPPQCPAPEGEEEGGLPAVACVRFSAEACLRGEVRSSLQQGQLRYTNGVLAAETEAPDKETGVDVPAYAFTCDTGAKGNGTVHYDERVAVVAALRHIETGTPVLAVCTHLAHSQNAPMPEAIRAFQLKQLDVALAAMREQWGMQDAPVVLMADGNDTPRLRDYGRGEAYTPMYATALALGWKDLLGEDFAPTSITLNRRYRIDYIMARPGSSSSSSQPAWHVEAARAPVPPLHVRLVGLDPVSGEKVLVPMEEEEDKAIYGAPLPAVGGQPVVPSDHLHCSCWVRLFRPVGQQAMAAAGEGRQGQGQREEGGAGGDETRTG